MYDGGFKGDFKESLLDENTCISHLLSRPLFRKLSFSLQGRIIN